MKMQKCPPVNLHTMSLLTVAGDCQCDQHNRDANERAAEAQMEARNRLVMRFLPFVYLEDQNLDPVTLMDRVAERLWIAANKEKQRRKSLQDA
jgi:hypothetical protein